MVVRGMSCFTESGNALIKSILNAVNDCMIWDIPQSYEAVLTAPTCIQDGTKTAVCDREAHGDRRCVFCDSFCYEPVMWALENGITSGMDTTYFGFTVYCNRAQVVTFLPRVMDK